MPLSIPEDKERVLLHLKANLMNFPDDPDEVEDIMPQMRMQASSIVKLISADDMRPAELMALMSLIGPVLARTPVLVPPKRPKRFPLRAV